MNSFTFDTFQIGEQASFTETITDEKMSQFLSICGDRNPMHMDDEYAKSKGYASRLVYGMLTASMYSTLAGMYLPGQRCILKSVETSFQNPVYVGDVITVSGRVVEKDERFLQATVKARIVNQKEKTVSKAKIIVGFYE